MGSIILIDFKIIGSFPSKHILWGTIRSTHSLLHGVSYAVLEDGLQYF